MTRFAALFFIVVTVTGCDSRAVTQHAGAASSSVPAPAASLTPTIQYQRVSATGTGANFDDALRSALIGAVGQVNGVNVSQSVISDKVIGSYHEQAKSDSSGQSSSSITASGSASGTVAAEGHTRDFAVQGSGNLQERATSSANQSSKSSVEFDSSHQTISAESQTGGAVRRYQVLNSTNRDGTWTVAISAEIAVYQSSLASKRLKIAVVPFRIAAQNKESTAFEFALRSKITDDLTQSGKVAILDRSYTQEDQEELSRLQTPAASKAEAAKLGNQLGADYILVGTLNSAAVTTDSTYFRTVNKTVYGTSHARADLQFRLIEAATGVVGLASSIPADRFDTSSMAELSQKQADAIVASMLGELFPLRVEKIASDAMYLGQGGDSIHVGDTYELIQQGAPITDSYTHELLGRQETKLGQIVVTEVQARLSKAEMVGGGPINFTDPHALIVRRSESAKPKPIVRNAVAPANVPDTQVAPASPDQPAENDPKSLLDKNKGNF